jgi:hypothetical protein
VGILVIFFKKKETFLRPRDNKLLNSHISQREFTLPAKRLFAFKIEIIVEVAVVKF